MLYSVGWTINQIAAVDSVTADVAPNPKDTVFLQNYQNSVVFRDYFKCSQCLFKNNPHLTDIRLCLGLQHSQETAVKISFQQLRYYALLGFLGFQKLCHIRVP